MREKGRRTKRITIYAYIFIQFKMDNIYKNYGLNTSKLKI